jgi:hypothetical protein
MQDVLGDWHDWLQLAQKTQQHFGGIEESPLSAALHNITRAKFRQALDVLGETRTALKGKLEFPPAHKPARAASKAHEAVA